MSAALLGFPEKLHSPHDDLQSVYWAALENALNYLCHDYSNLLGAAQCLVNYRPLIERGGCIKSGYLSEAPSIDFVGNPTFSSLLHDFGRMVGYADRWEANLARHKYPTEDGLRASSVPNHHHDAILERFNEALR